MEKSQDKERVIKESITESGVDEKPYMAFDENHLLGENLNLEIRNIFSIGMSFFYYNCIIGIIGNIIEG